MILADIYYSSQTLNSYRAEFFKKETLKKRIDKLKTNI